MHQRRRWRAGRGAGSLRPPARSGSARAQATMSDPSSFPPTAQLYTDADTGMLRERTYRLVVAEGPDRGLEQILTAGTTLVGTHPNNEVVLSDKTVSRYHLELQLRADGLQIRDLDTTNGTLHGGTRVGSIVITGAARLRLGKHTFVDLEPVDETVDLPEFQGDRFGDVLGASVAMRRLFGLLARTAPTDATLLIEGETGTGKEAIAEAVHRHSARAGGPFVVVDCGAIPRELIASELFGHVKGSFTGAAADKTGLVAAADGGTLFLDEIGELSLELQPQLLRVLEKREVRRVGDTRGQRVDIRIIAATHRDLRAMVREGTFREDLYFRLAVVRAVVPPLRERIEDVPMLALHFARHFGRGDIALPPALLDELRAHDWPGNVRELRNVVERALSLGTSGLAAAAHAPAGPPDPVPTDPAHDPAILDRPFKDAKSELIERFERAYLEHLLAKHRGNISRAAADAGIDRNYIHRLVKKYGMRVDRG
ncbi:MAG: FHA domain-containing protein [Deltaproteobacteria bacterium]|nr:MAG: FHA domain-containing protein [Deltaproteobacteria bacterium]